uniref:Uncharacterized protein n=1 Tax=Arundo donax TaxID=35708 RepID=A0A0A9HLA3_ARUDO
MNATWSGFSPTRHISSNSSRASLLWPCSASPTIIAVHETTSSFVRLENTTSASDKLPLFPYISISALLTITWCSSPAETARLWSCRPASNAAAFAQTLRRLATVNSLGRGQLL